MKFKNELNKKELEKALVNWVLGTDGQDGATCEVLATIPWNDEMERVIPWRCVDEDIDEAIGIRGEWNVYRLLRCDSTVEDKKYKDEFNRFIDVKVKCIDIVYDEIIKQLNDKIKPKRKYKVYTSYCLEVEAETYVEAEAKAEENISKLDGLGGDWCWCEDFDAVLEKSP